MSKVTKIVDGNLANREQKEIIVGNGSIVTYILSEHQFEELGKNKDYIKYQSRCVFCLGIIIPLTIDILTWEGTIYCRAFILKSVVVLAFTIVLILSFYDYVKGQRAAKSIYDSLKAQARQLTDRL